jgi:hypothetical protein
LAPWRTKEAIGFEEAGPSARAVLRRAWDVPQLSVGDVAAVRAVAASQMRGRACCSCRDLWRTSPSTGPLAAVDLSQQSALATPINPQLPHA